MFIVKMFCCKSTNAVARTNRPRNSFDQHGVNNNEEVSIHFSQSVKDENEANEQTIYSGDVLDAVRIDWSELSFDLTKRDSILGKLLAHYYYLLMYTLSCFFSLLTRLRYVWCCNKRNMDTKSNKYIK